MNIARTHACAALMALGLASAAVPVHGQRPDHVVVVIEENHGFSQIMGDPDCPFIRSLAAQGTLLTRSHAITHPSEPNYLALFAGDTFGSPQDLCPPPGSPYAHANLADLLEGAGLSFAGYSEGLPHTGDAACQDADPNGYRRKHNPWVDFSDVPATDNRPWSAFPKDYSRLPTVAMVVPDLEHDMHNGSPAEADRWLKSHLGGYALWARTHASLLIVTWDEDNGAEGNRIVTLFVGQNVRVARLGQATNHYGLLRSLCDWYGLKAPGHAASARAIRGIFF